MNSKLEILFRGLSAQYCLLLYIFLIRDVEVTFNPIQPTSWDAEKAIQSKFVSCLDIWFIYMRYNPLGGSVAYKQILYTGIRNLSGGEFRVSFLSIPRTVVCGRHCCSHSLFIIIFCLFFIALSLFFGDQNDP